MVRVRSRVSKTVLSACLAAFGFPGQASATEPVKTTTESGLSVETSIGVMNGLAQEFVYNPDGSELSRLDWSFDNILMFNGGITYDINPKARVGLRGSFSLSGSSYMEDYDFNLGFCPPAPGGGTQCLSTHPDTQLRQAWMLDVFGEYDVWQNEALTVSLVGGYKRDHYQWAAIGGTANYGVLPPGIGISYEQNWSTPYVGIGVEAVRGRSTFTGRLVGSTWAQGDDVDNHHFRSLVFSEGFSSTNFVQAQLGYRYQLRPNVELTAGYQFQHWGTGKGPTTIHQRVGDSISVIAGDAAGANAQTHMLSIGMNVALGSAGAEFAEGDATGLSGFYFGSSASLDWRSNAWSTLSVFAPPPLGDPALAETADAELSSFGQRRGAFLGWEQDKGTWFWGIEGDVGKSNANGWAHGIPGIGDSAFLASATDTIAVTHGVDASLRLRLGKSVSPRLNVYATAGLALGQVEAATSCPARGIGWCSSSNYEEAEKLLAGWTVGAGAELKFGDKWFTRGEYRYTDLGSFRHDFFAATPFDTFTAEIGSRGHRLDLGIGYRF